MLPFAMVMFDGICPIAAIGRGQASHLIRVGEPTFLAALGGASLLSKLCGLSHSG
jgi:hypothetical protein